MFGEGAGDDRIAVRPVADKRDDALIPERLLHRRAVDRACFVRLARQAPVGGEIDEHGLSRCTRLGEGGGREGAVVFCGGNPAGLCELIHGVGAEEIEDRNIRYERRLSGEFSPLPSADHHYEDYDEDADVHPPMHSGSGLSPEQPIKTERRQSHWQRHPLTKCRHPRPRLWQAAAKRRDEADSKERQGEPQAQPAKDRERRPRRQHQRRAKRGAEQGAAARGRDEGGKSAGPEATRRAALTGQRLPAAE